MQWLRRLFTPQEPPSDLMRRELRELAELAHALESDIRVLRKEWAAEQLAMSDLVAKQTAWVGRLAARERRKAEKALEDHAPDQLDALPAPAPTRDVRLMSKPELRALAAAQRQNGGAR